MVDIFLAQVKNIVYLCIVIGLETVAVKSLTDTFVVRLLSGQNSIPFRLNPLSKGIIY